jgi:hypothetical protein
VEVTPAGMGVLLCYTRDGCLIPFDPGLEKADRLVFSTVWILESTFSVWHGKVFDPCDIPAKIGQLPTDQLGSRAISRVGRGGSESCAVTTLAQGVGPTPAALWHPPAPPLRAKGRHLWVDHYVTSNVTLDSAKLGVNSMVSRVFFSAGRRCDAVGRPRIVLQSPV